MRLVRWLVLDVPEYARINSENHRWTRTVTSIFQFEDCFFSVDWEEGLTEMQERDYKDGDQVQVTINGTIYLVHSSKCVLINDK